MLLSAVHGTVVRSSVRDIQRWICTAAFRLECVCSHFQKWNLMFTLT